MKNGKVLVAVCSLLAAAQLCYGGAEATVKADGFAKIVSQIEGAGARTFFDGLAASGDEFTFAYVEDAAELGDDDLWLEVDGERVPVEKDYMLAFFDVFTEGRATLTPRDEKATARSAGQEPPPAASKPKGKAGKKKGGAGKRSGAEAEEAPSGPTYRLSCVYGRGFTYSDVTFAADDPGKIYPDYKVAGIVDELRFKDFPYNKNGDAQKLFRECQKKIEGVMSSASGREGVLRTYAYYDIKGQSWDTALLKDLLSEYELGKISKE
jgi:hypothetical protein